MEATKVLTSPAWRKSLSYPGSLTSRNWKSWQFDLARVPIGLFAGAVMKIALIDPNGQYGGVHYYSDQLAEGITESGADVTLYTSNSDGLGDKKRVYRYIEVFDEIFGKRNILIRGLRYLIGLGKLEALLRSQHPDIAHVNVYHFNFISLALVAMLRLLCYSYIVTLHDVVPFGRSVGAWRRNFILSGSKGIVVHNEFCRNALLESCKLNLPIAVIPHVKISDLSDDRLDKAHARRLLDIPADPFVLLFFGNSRQEKGLDIAIRALALVDRKDVLLTIAGKMRPREVEDLNILIDERGVRDKVKLFIGFVPDNLAIAHYKASDLLLLPYRRVYESGVAIMAAGLQRTIIASDIGPFNEITENGTLGFLFECNSERSLGEAISRAYDSRHVLGTLGLAMYEKCKRERSAERIGFLVRQFYEKVASTEPGGCHYR